MRSTLSIVLGLFLVLAPTLTLAQSIGTGISQLQQWRSENSTFLTPVNASYTIRMPDGFLSQASSTVSGILTSATTTTGALNGAIIVSGWPFAKSGVGIQQAINVCSALGSS